jgi:Flp pilus assembly protein protease CpaA
MSTVLFLIPFVILGIYSSYTDITAGIIKNKHLLIAIYTAILIHIYIIFTGDIINLKAYQDYLTNAIFILVMSFIFWNIGLWTAGDAKLFFVFNLLVPPDFIVKGYGGMFYGLVFFVNIFGIMLFYFIYKVVQKVSWIQFKKALRQTLVLRNVLSVLLFMFSVSYLMRFIPNFHQNNFFIGVLIIFILYSILEMLIGQKRIIYVFLLLAIARAVLDFATIIQLDFWMRLGTNIALLLFMRFLLLRLSYLAFTTKIHINDLQPKMFLAEDIIKVKIIEKNEERKKKMKSQIQYRKQALHNFTFFAYLKNNAFLFKEYDKNLGLTQDNISWIKKHKKEIQFQKLRIFETMPFAPFIFLGMALTIIGKGNIFVYIQELINVLFPK